MKISFRPHKRIDIAYRVKWLNNPKVNLFIGDVGAKTNLTKQSKWFDDYEKDKNKKFFTILVDKVPIGFMGFSKISRSDGTADLHIAIGEDAYRGKGFGKKSLQLLIDYGFNKLGLQKINLGVFSENKIAIKCYKSFGFKVEGVLKREAFFNGKYHNLILMAIFKKI